MPVGGEPANAIDGTAHLDNQRRTTSLMYACQQGDYQKVKELIKNQPKLLDLQDRTLKTALHYCAGRERQTTHCADLLVMADPSLVESRDEDGFTPLHLAVISGNVQLVHFLLANGADVNALDSERHSVVHWATVCGEAASLVAVLSTGAEVSTPDVHGGYPLHYAAQMCGSERDQLGLQVLHILLSQPNVDVSVADNDGRQPLLWAASAGSAKAVLALVRAGAIVEAPDKDGLTALHCAASRGHTDCLDTLLTLCGATPDVIDTNGCTALHYSVTLGHADATALLLSHGSDPNRQDRKGRSPAHCGCAKGQLETVKLLGQHQANLWLRNARGDLPLHEAAASGRRDLVRWLLDQRPSQVNARNNDGRCPIHLAALNDNSDMCKILLDGGAYVNPVLRTSKNLLMTPLDCAMQRGFRSTAKFLQLHGGVPATRLSSLRVGSDITASIPTGTNFQIREDITLLDGSSTESDIDEKKDSKPRKRSIRRRVVARYGSKTKESASDEDTQIRANKRVVKTDKMNNKQHSDDKISDHEKKFKVDEKNKSRDDQDDIKDTRQTEETKKNGSAEKKTSDTSEKTIRQRPKSAKKREFNKRKSTELSAPITHEGKVVSDVEHENGQNNVHKHSDDEQSKTMVVEAAVHLPPKESIEKNGSHQEEKDIQKTITKEVESADVTKHQEDVIEQTQVGTAPENGGQKPNGGSIDNGGQKQDGGVIDNGGQKQDGDLVDDEKKQNGTAADNGGQKSPDEQKQEGSTSDKEKQNGSTPDADGIKQNGDGDSSVIKQDSGDGGQNDKPGILKETSKSEEKLDEQKPKTPPKNGDAKPESPKSKDVKKESPKKEDSKSESPKKDTTSPKNGSNKTVTIEPSALKEDEGKTSEDYVESEDYPEKPHEKKGVATTFGPAEGLIVENTSSAITAIIGDVFTKDDLTTSNTEELTHDEAKKSNELNIDLSLKKFEESADMTDSTGPETKIRKERSRSRKKRLKPVDDTTDDLSPEKEYSQPSEHSSSDEARKSIDHPSFQVLDDEVPFQVLDETKESKRKNRRSLTKVHLEPESPDVAIRSRSVSNEKERGISSCDTHSMTLPVLSDKVRSESNLSAPHLSSVFSDNEHKSESNSEELDVLSSGNRKKKFKRKKTRLGTKSAGSDYESSVLIDSGFEPSPRSSRIPKRKVMSERGVNMTSVTQSIQTNIRRYHMERKIFQHLLELKRLQIRSGQANEAVLVKRAIDTYHSSIAASVGAGRYTKKDYTYKSFEQFLYHSLRMLQRGQAEHLKGLPETPDNPLLCTQSTHRCLHATHAYTGIPCAAYIPKVNHHTMPKIGFSTKSQSFLPQIHTKGKGVTLELCHGNDKQVISLPADRLDQNKKYYVTFTVKGQEAQSPSDQGSTSHRHAKSV